MFILYLINFLLAVSSSMAMSLAPLFMTQTMGLSRLTFGVLEGFYELSADFMKLLSGRLIDRTHKKKGWIALGIVFSCLSKPFLMFGMTPSFISLCLSRLLERMSNGSVASARDILIAVQSPEDARGKAYGKIMISKTLGCFIGPFLLAFWCVLYPSADDSHYISLILVSLLFSLLAGWFMGYLPHDRGEDKLKHISAPDWEEIWKLVMSHKALLASFSLFMLGRFNDGILIFYLKEMNFPPEFYLSTIGIFNYVSLITAHPVGRLLDRGYIRPLLYATVLALVLFNACFLIGGELWLFMLGVAFWGFQRSSFQIIFTTALSHIVPLSHLGTALGLAAILKGVVFLVSCTVAGVLSGYSYTWVFLFSLITSVLTLLTIPRKSLLARAPAQPLCESRNEE